MKILGTSFHRRTVAAHRALQASPPRVEPGRPVSNWYEGGYPLLTGDRSFIPQLDQDARFDQNAVTRKEFRRKSRYFAQNNPVIKRILEVDQSYTVGANGLHVTPASSGSEWNKKAKDVWWELCQSAGLDGEDLTSMIHTAHQCETTDGEIFPLKTSRKFTERELSWRAKGGRIVGSRPCVQLVEAHRVETPFGRWNDEGDSVIDGVQVETQTLPDGRKARRKTGYWVRSSFGSFDLEQSWDFFPMDGLVHVGEAQRAGQIRFISRFYSMLNVVHDFDDLQQCEMKAAKDGAEKSTIISTPSGELNAAEFLRKAYNGRPLAEADGEWKKRYEFYRQVLGGRTLAVRTGDKVEQYLNNRPTVTSREYWMFLISVICAGLGVSVLLVFPDFSGNDQGTAVRAELDIANQLFIRRGRKWRMLMSDLWEYFIGWAIKNDSRLVNPPPDWRKVIVYPPRGCNVDVGNNSKAMLDQLAAGATDYELIYGPLGLDWEERFEALAKQQEKADALGLKLQVGKPQPEPLGGEPNA